MKKLYFALLVLLSVCTANSAFGQSISIGSFNTGAYARGSSITVPINLSGIFNTNEKFEMWLSDASGNFSSGTKIGEFQGFYSTFVNGVIPSSAVDGTAYRIQIRSTSTTLTSNVTNITNSFSIQGSQAVIAKLKASNGTEFRTNEIFGNCSAGLTYIDFADLSTSGSVRTVNIKNEITGVVAPTFTSSDVYTIDPLAKAHYTVTITAVKNGILGTWSYFLINNYTYSPFSSTYNQVICLPGSLDYVIDYQSQNGIGNNFPGNTYEINWKMNLDD
jgi:hypothetical protein